jgi:peptidoglycan/xylan/chitin deacetylase (PgdA/CDA1 family)
VRVALTFDAEHPDRPHRPGVQEGILDVLRDRSVRATFFLQGRWVEAFPETARRVARDGHLVGSHSFYHARMPLLSDAGMATDIGDAEAVIRDIVGVDPRPWFRCPFFAGGDDPRVLGILAERGYREIPTDIILDDWDPERTGEAIAADALAAIRTAADGPVVLFHTWPPQTLDALPAVVDGLRDLGARFVTVADLPVARWPVAAR